MKRNNIDHTRFRVEVAILSDPKTNKKDNSHHDRQLRNNIIGEEVGIDLYAYMNKKSLLNVRDKASGYAFDVKLINHSKNKNIPQAIQTMFLKDMDTKIRHAAIAAPSV